MGTPKVLVLREDSGTQNGKILFKVTHGSSWVADHGGFSAHPC